MFIGWKVGDHLQQPWGPVGSSGPICPQRQTNPGQEDSTENQKPRQGSILQLEEVLNNQGAEFPSWKQQPGGADDSINEMTFKGWH